MMDIFNEIQLGDKIRVEDKSAILHGEGVTNGGVYPVVGKNLETPESYSAIKILDDLNEEFVILASELHAVSKVM